MEELQSFIGKRIDIRKVQEEQTITSKGYWALNENCRSVFKGKETTANIISANWVGSVGQAIYFVNGDVLESDPEERTSYGINILVNETGNIENFEIFSEAGSNPCTCKQEMACRLRWLRTSWISWNRLLKYRAIVVYQPK